MTTPEPWSMNSPSPTVAAGWISTPVSERAAPAMTRGTTGTPTWSSACATRCASRAWTPGQVATIPRAETPRAAGSRSRAARTSRDTSRASWATVLRPSMRVTLLTVGTVRPPGRAHAQEVARAQVNLQERVEQRARQAREQAQRLERLQGADDAGG